MNVLMVDVGGTNLKVMVSHDGEVHKMPSGQTLTASEMVQGVLGLSADLEFDRVSLGIPGLVEHGKPALEPGNLGGGWVDFDYSKAFGRPFVVSTTRRCKPWEITTAAVFFFLASVLVLELR